MGGTSTPFASCLGDKENELDMGEKLVVTGFTSTPVLNPCARRLLPKPGSASNAMLAWEVNTSILKVHYFHTT
jgi:hypothetical protein